MTAVGLVSVDGRVKLLDALRQAERYARP